MQKKKKGNKLLPKIKNMITDLSDLFKEGDRLQEEVKKQLDSIGWEIENE